MWYAVLVYGGGWGAPWTWAGGSPLFWFMRRRIAENIESDAAKRKSAIDRALGKAGSVVKKFKGR